MSQTTSADTGTETTVPVDRALYVMHMSGPVATPLVDAVAAALAPLEHAIVDDEGDPERSLGRDELATLETDERARLRIIVGDFPYGLHNGTPVPFSYLAFLQEPLARVLERHRRFVTLQRHVFMDRDRSASEQPAPLSLERFVFELRHLAIDNGMVRAIAARRRIRFGQCPDDLLEEARAHMREHFAALLVSEDLRTSVPILESLLGRALPGLADVELEPADVAASDIEPSLAERIRDLNRLDARLYEEARDALTQIYGRLVG